MRRSRAPSCAVTCHCLGPSQGDADLMAAWVRDLGRVGYAFPEARPAAADAARLGGAQSAPAPAGQLPRTPQSWRRHRDIVLVLVFNRRALNHCGVMTGQCNISSASQSCCVACHKKGELVR